LTEFDLDGSIFYVPRALEFARHLPFEELADEEYANDLWWTCGALLTFLNTWHAELDLAGLTEPIMTAVDAARVHWTETFPPPHSQLLSKGIAESCEWWPATILLNTPLEPASASVARTQFVDLLSRWTANLSSAAASANLLALFFAMRSVGGHMKLFKDSFMVGCASDKELCARHWQIAAPLLASACGTEYTELLKLELLKT
jgi:hypothetical protein